MAKISDLVGVTFKSVEQRGTDEIHFVAQDGRHWRFYHEQDCCEGVDVEDICGDLSDLVGTPLLQAEDVSDETPDPEDPGYESYTWTFYKFATIKGSVTVRWLGVSNGYYSESVDFEQVGLH